MILSIFLPMAKKRSPRDLDKQGTSDTGRDLAEAMLTYHDQRWLTQYENVVRFRKLHRRWPHPTERFPGRIQIGQWHYRNRQAFLAGTLKPYREALLREIGLTEFFIRHVDAHWEERFNHLKRFRRKHPDRWPYTREEFPKGNKLGRWFHEQKMRNTRGTLKKKWRVLLRSIGFPFGVKVVKRKDRWQKQYEALKAFRKKNPARWPAKGDGSSPSDPMGNWCSAQRWYRRIGALSKERSRLLDAIEFDWDPVASLWMRQYRFLLVFRKEHPGKRPSVKSRDAEERTLAAWLAQQRKKFRQGKLSNQRLRLLRSMPEGFRAALGKMQLSWPQPPPPGGSTKAL